MRELQRQAGNIRQQNDIVIPLDINVFIIK